MSKIPVYLFTEMLESGKTQFISGRIKNGFASERHTLLLLCEQGEIEYESTALKNISVIAIENFRELTPEYLSDIAAKHSPDQLIVELNRMCPA